MPLEAETRKQLDPEVRSYIEELESRNDQLQEELRLALHKKFSRSSEQDAAQSEQLFSEAEAGATETEGSEETEADETVSVSGHTRSKRGRKPIDEHVPRVAPLRLTMSFGRPVLKSAHGNAAVPADPLLRLRAQERWQNYRLRVTIDRCRICLRDKFAQSYR
jgi:hypothetical protein